MLLVLGPHPLECHTLSPIVSGHFLVCVCVGGLSFFQHGQTGYSSGAGASFLTANRGQGAGGGENVGPSVAGLPDGIVQSDPASRSSEEGGIASVSMTEGSLGSFHRQLPSVMSV